MVMGNGSVPQVATKNELEKMLDEGLTHQQIVERIAEETGEIVSLS